MFNKQTFTFKKKPFEKIGIYFSRDLTYRPIMIQFLADSPQLSISKN